MWKRVTWAWEDVKAWRRREKRVALRGVTGRIYEKVKQEETVLNGSLRPTVTTGEVEIKARVLRAATGEWEDLGVIAKGQATEIK